MRINTAHNPVIQYVFVACLSLVLTLGQTFKLHMHVTDTQDVFTHTTSEQLGQVHIASTLHDTLTNDEVQTDNQTHKHTNEIEISSDSFSKKAELFSLAALLFLVATILLLNPRRVLRISKRFSNAHQLARPLLYLINPPLRAPPSNQFV